MARGCCRSFDSRLTLNCVDESGRVIVGAVMAQVENNKGSKVAMR
jgi:hypothetical protein